ncbi:MAG: OadG family protein [Leptospiraceae bacterium]|nr:OadG family protein [Leptospiraceae bacterium]MCP5503269.1 OadG family protein [Leptospiraceae bacterium]
MIFEGIKLTILGLSVVYLYLLLLVAAIQLIYKFSKKNTLQEEEELKKAASLKKRTLSKEKDTLDDKNLIAAITAAIHAHRQKL